MVRRRSQSAAAQIFGAWQIGTVGGLFAGIIIFLDRKAATVAALVAGLQPDE